MHALCKTLTLAVTWILLAQPSETRVLAENWPGWRGPHRSGVTSETGVPTKWTESENVVWKTPLSGAGTSNPVVWQEHVFLTASEGKDHGELRVFCYDRDTGKERWQRRFWGTQPTWFYGRSGMASPSPVTDGERLFVFFGTGDVFCLDLGGRLLWQRALADEYGAFENRFAASSSPLLHAGKLILQCDHYGASYVVALDQKTGENVWKSDRPEVWLSWSSPQLVPVGNQFELVVSGSEKLDGYDPLTGSRLWTVRGLARECIPTPLFGQSLIYVVSGPNGMHYAIKPGGRGDVSDSNVVWKNDRGTSFVPSAILVGERYYIADDKGFATCFEASSGQIAWRKRLNGKYTASPVSAEGKIFFTSETGSTLVIDAMQREYTEVARNELGEEIFASAAISQRRLFFRSARHLICVGLLERSE